MSSHRRRFRHLGEGGRSGGRPSSTVGIDYICDAGDIADSIRAGARGTLGSCRNCEGEVPRIANAIDKTATCHKHWCGYGTTSCATIKDGITLLGLNTTGTKACTPCLCSDSLKHEPRNDDETSGWHVGGKKCGLCKVCLVCTQVYM